MRSPEQYVQQPPARWWQAVCVLGLLAGLLGMHGLAPGGGLPAHSAGPSHAPSAPSAPPGPTAADPHTAPTATGPPAADPYTASTATVADTGLPAAPSAPVAAGAAHAGCPQNEGSCGGGHLRHADVVCASGAVGDGPALPAPLPDPVPVVVCDGIVRAYTAGAPDGARAPPSLAELQLLRI
ncbi:DUF6153 family protein [Streptomyces sp. NPDC048392]|uniref:DUF6153 family protein n=1 Tax=Streptomyces sp. NPDC048392 TaxID=3365543 RepID=UPI00371D081D